MRSARQVFDDHWNAVLSGDMDRILADYAPDAVFVQPGAVARGHAGIQAVFEGIGENVGEMAVQSGLGNRWRLDGPLGVERPGRRRTERWRRRLVLH